MEAAKKLLKLSGKRAGKLKKVPSCVRDTKRASNCHFDCTGTLRPDDLDVNGFSRLLQHSEVPDPDLLIRTSGELRVR